MSEANSTARYRPETKLVHAGALRSQYGETSEALFLTQGFIYDTAERCGARFKGEDPGFLYSRFSNPNISMFERRMIELEGAEAARATATGMAAVTTAVLAPLKAGDHVVAAKAMFGSCRYVVEDLLPRYGIQSTLVDGLDLDQWRKAMRPNTKSCFLESPTNPTLDVMDISAIAEIAHQAGARLIVDNVFATPIWQSPLSLGADVVVYSATKHIDGQGRCLGGVILSSDAFIDEHIHNFMRQTGPSMSPFNAWVLLKGLETLRCGCGADRDRGEDCRRARQPSEDFAADLSRPRRPSAGRGGEAADAIGLDPDRLRGQGRQGRRVPRPQRAEDIAETQDRGWPAGSGFRQRDMRAGSGPHPPSPRSCGRAEFRWRRAAAKTTRRGPLGRPDWPPSRPLK